MISGNAENAREGEKRPVYHREGASGSQNIETTKGEGKSEYWEGKKYYHEKPPRVKAIWRGNKKISPEKLKVKNPRKFCITLYVDTFAMNLP